MPKCYVFVPSSTAYKRPIKKTVCRLNAEQRKNNSNKNSKISFFNDSALELKSAIKPKSFNS